MLPVLRNSATALTPASAGPANRLSSLFDHFFNDDFFAPLTAGPTWTPPLAMWEDEHNVYIEADLPGVADKDIDLAVHQRNFLLRWERQGQNRDGGYDGRAYGRFEQRLNLPCEVDADKVEARLAGGVLKVALPKSACAKPHRITVKAE